MLKTGQPAPEFELPDADMELVDLARYRGKNHVVLFFYPKDGTPGCIQEATEFSDHEEDFAAAGAVVLGLSRDDCLRHADFRDRHGISIRLLSDEEGSVSQDYGVWQQREVDGITKNGIVRSTFVIDKRGVVRHALYGVNAKGHAMEVLRLVKQLD